MPALDTPVISMRNVNHFYGTGALRRQVLFEVSCDIWPGEIVIVTGPSGSGKTTVLTLAGALRSVQQGSMKILGDELKGASNRTLVRIRERVGFIFQLHNLLDCLSARQNVELALGLESLPKRESRARATAILDSVGLGEHLSHFPSQLSGGERQRVAVARALVRHPKVVLADEPTASLGKQAGRQVVELLRQLARKEGCAVLLVTHDHRILDIADRIMKLEDGVLQSFGELMSPHAGHLLTAFAQLPDREHLDALLRDVKEGRFLDLIKAMAAECEQFLNVLDMGDRESIEHLFQNLLDVICGKVSGLLDAEQACVFMFHDGRLRPAAGDWNRAPAGPAERAAESGEFVNLSGDGLGPGVRSVLCMPLSGRDSQIRAVAQMVNKRGGGGFTRSDERAFRDFAGPLGMIIESCDRIRRGESV